MPPPIRTAGLRHRLALRMPVDKSYPGIQPTMARKAGDLLTVTLCERCSLDKLPGTLHAVKLPSAFSRLKLFPSNPTPAAKKRRTPSR
jgi:hypothetical protein